MKHWSALKADLGRTYFYARGGACLQEPSVRAHSGRARRHRVAVRAMGAIVALLFRLVLDPIYFVLNLLIQMMWGIEIPRATLVGPGLFIGHFGGITISASARAR